MRLQSRCTCEPLQCCHHTRYRISSHSLSPIHTNRCPNGTTLYGFTEAKASGNRTRAAPYHYYDANLPLQRDDVSDMALRLRRMLRDEPGCVRLPRAAGVAAAHSFATPVRSRGSALDSDRADPLVDGLRHPFSYDAVALR